MSNFSRCLIKFLILCHFLTTTFLWIILVFTYAPIALGDENKVLTLYWIFNAIGMVGGLHYILYTIYHVFKKCVKLRRCMKRKEMEKNKHVDDNDDILELNKELLNSYRRVSLILRNNYG